MAVYLDNAATSFPKPQAVYTRLAEWLVKYGASPGRGGYEMARAAGAMVKETRRLLATLFNVGDPDRVVLTLNATDALNMAIKGVLRPGDHVVTTVIEHNSVSRPLTAMERAGTIQVTRVPVSADGFVDPEMIQRAMTPRTKLVAVLHASNVLGSIQPIEAIGQIVRETGSLFLIDAAQTAGHYAIDVERAAIDLLAFPGHKGLLGLPGTGGLYVGPRVQEMRPWREGGTGISSEHPVQPDEFPLRLEAGSPNTLGIAGLGEAVRYILERGVEQMRAHELVLVQHLLEPLRSDDRFVVYGPRRIEERGAVVSLNVVGCPPSVVGEYLDRVFHIAVRTGLHCAPGAHRHLGTFPDGAVRITPGPFSTEDDIALCVEALREAAEALANRHPPAMATR